jgi:hypothetical protein
LGGLGHRQKQKEKRKKKKPKQTQTDESAKGGKSTNLTSCIAKDRVG